jgi:hypothetical protein
MKWGSSRVNPSIIGDKEVVSEIRLSKRGKMTLPFVLGKGLKLSFAHSDNIPVGQGDNIVWSLAET